MKGKLVLFVLLLFVLSSFEVSAAKSCTSFCKTKDYTQGVCRTTTDAGFCKDAEVVYGFSPCSDYKRCCCGNLAEVNESLAVSENSSAEPISSVVAPDFHVGTFAKSIFWYLVVLVVLLALAVVIKNKAFSPEKSEEGKTKEELL